MARLRRATLDDVADLLPRIRELNAHEGIVISDELLEPALRRLLGDASLGGVWLIATGDAGTDLDRGADLECDVIGYATVTFGYDLEFGGRDAYLTELWIDDGKRGGGAGSAALDRLVDELRALDVRALHLQVRPDNPALRLYARSGFVQSPRVVMTRRLV